ncbi:hypothetical protein E4U13_006560 [Claviceps humidiphila]|uniref:Uncharacterized protein n=1 Tax=Claviceps humidiphila TaxID=1294629 RepID=A0A9P7PWF2_9HYPO|nr:hypothetical protein E4U13_006560 [Claviceps humidiphila]
MAHSQTRVLQPMVTIGRQQLEDDKTRTTRRERPDENGGEENNYSQGDDDGDAATCWRRPGSKNSSTRFDAEKELISSSKQPPQAQVKWPMQPGIKRVGTDLLVGYPKKRTTMKMTIVGINKVSK